MDRHRPLVRRAHGVHGLLLDQRAARRVERVTEPRSNRGGAALGGRVCDGTPAVHREAVRRLRVGRRVRDTRRRARRAQDLLRSRQGRMQRPRLHDGLRHPRWHAEPDPLRDQREQHGSHEALRRLCRVGMSRRHAVRSAGRSRVRRRRDGHLRPRRRTWREGHAELDRVARGAAVRPRRVRAEVASRLDATGTAAGPHPPETTELSGCASAPGYDRQGRAARPPSRCLRLRQSLPCVCVLRPLVVVASCLRSPRARWVPRC